MKFVLACYGTRGDIEACAAVGRELTRRGHDVRLAVPPDLVGLVESAGLAAVGYGPNTQAHCDLWQRFPPNLWKMHALIGWLREFGALTGPCWAEIITTLRSLADGADVLVSGLGFEEAVAIVAEYHDIPLATLHWLPVRANSKIIRHVPAPLARVGMTVWDWLRWQLTRRVEKAQRGELGLPKSTGRSTRRITERGSLEIQAYDAACFPGLAAEWMNWKSQRPFVGTLTMGLTTDHDDEIASWVAARTPPICFSFGSNAIASPADTVAMVSAACARLGERALICSAATDFGGVAPPAHVKIVGAMNYAATFPACRAVVHHGGAGTTAAALRAGVPALILWTLPDQPMWGWQLKALKVGFGRRFSSVSQESLVAGLRRILAPEYVTRAREIATHMTKPADSVAAAADLVENFALARRVG